MRVRVLAYPMAVNHPGESLSDNPHLLPKGTRVILLAEGNVVPSGAHCAMLLTPVGLRVRFYVPTLESRSLSLDWWVW